MPRDSHHERKGASGTILAFSGVALAVAAGSSRRELPRRAPANRQEKKIATQHRENDQPC